ncbi:MAG TPA: hypothetical protein VL418_02450 [Devosiaceae bacterium]|nr:hypothetical protein [Devosiaceae bacterium]
MRRALLVPIVMLGLWQAAPAFAQSVEDVDRAEQVVDTIWAQTPLSFRKALFVTGDPGGFGIYSARPDVPFKKGEKLVVYAEPVGYGWKDNGDGTYSFGFDVDLSIKSPDGTETVQKNFSHLVLSSHAKNHEFMLTLTLNVDGAGPGKYLLQYTTHDIASNKSAVISLPFTIAD